MIARVHDEAMRAFLATMNQVHSTAPTWCQGWSAHDIACHVGAAAQERADLIEESLAGLPERPTRSWEQREPPYRILDPASLRVRLAQEAVRFETALSAMPSSATITYTGWKMNAARLRMHSHSEAVLHRWDLLGDDDIGVRLLSNPALADHAIAAFAAIPLPEATRWTDSPVDAFAFAVEGQADVSVVKGSGLTRKSLRGRVPTIALRPHELPLMLWGRRPQRLRNVSNAIETFGQMLTRLVEQIV